MSEIYPHSLLAPNPIKEIEVDEAERLVIYVLCGLIIVLIAVVLLRGTIDYLHPIQ